MDAMDGAIFDGRELRVQTARYGRPNDSYRRHGGGGGRGGRGYRRSYRLETLNYFFGSQLASKGVITHSVFFSPLLNNAAFFV